MFLTLNAELLLGSASLIILVLAVLLRLSARRCHRMEQDLRDTEADLKIAQHALETHDATLDAAEKRIQNVLDSSAARALSKSNSEFLRLAEETFKRHHQQASNSLSEKHVAIAHLVQPLKDSLKQVDEKLAVLERKRESAYATIRTQIDAMADAQQALRKETANLSSALRNPMTRGRWGEIQLKRVVELSGMSQYCDFVEQQQVTNEDHKILRPDLVVKLPGNKQIIVDSKAPLNAYLDAMEAPDDAARKVALQNHARHVQKHMAQLSKKAYWQSGAGQELSPEFVIMFLPGEIFFTAALEQDPNLIESGITQNVILATPATLIAMLHAIAYGWRQERYAENTRDIARLGQTLSKRLEDLTQHISKLGKSLNNAVTHFNRTVGSLDRRVLPSALKLKELHGHNADKHAGASATYPTQIEQGVRVTESEADTDTQESQVAPSLHTEPLAQSG